MSTAGNDHVGYGRDPMRPCAYGLAIGDALGAPYGFRGRGTFECTGMAGGGTHGRYAGTRSDGTSTALCTCSGIERLGRIVTAGIDDMSNRWSEDGDRR